MATTAARPAERRAYRSGLREQQAAQTKRAIVGAAHDCFVAQGFTGTGMRQVAAAAGVAVDTVYSHFPSKRALLRAVIDLVAVGDDEAVPLAQRPEFTAMGKGRRGARVAAGAQLITTLHRRTLPIAKLLRDGAAADEEVAEMLQATRERQRTDIAAGLELIMGRPPTPEERDGVWAILSPEVYLLLVEESGWTAAGYEAWITATLDRVVPRS